MRTHLATFIVGAALLTGACAASGPPLDAADPPRPTPVDDPDHDVGWPMMAVDWYGDFSIDLPNGWTVRHCEGDAPMVCFADGDRHVGVVELGDYGLPDDFDGDSRSYLLAHADSFLDGMREDRAVGCSDHDFEATPPVEADLGGVRGVKAGFRLVDDAGAEMERVVLYWAVHDDAHFVITATSYADDGCMERLGEFEPHDLGIALPYIDRIAEETPLPDARHDR